MGTKRVVIVGSGLAGYSMAQELRKKDNALEIVLVTAEAGASYSKPMLSNAITQRRATAQLVTSPPEAMATRLNLVLNARERVTRIAVDGHYIETSARVVHYDALILGTGAAPIRAPIAGNAAHAVLTVNDLDDYTLFRQTVEGARRVLIMGAGLISCELANDLLSANVTPVIVDPGPQPLASLAAAETGRSLQRALEAGGAQWRFGRKVHSLPVDSGRYSALLNDGETLEVDAVLSAIGLRPRTELALTAGLHVNRGIMVDQYGRTNHPRIYAIGDCAEYEDGLRPYVRPVLVAAKAMAATITRTPTAITFPLMPVTVKTPRYPVAVLRPSVDQVGMWLAEPDCENHLVFRDNDGTIQGFSLGGTSSSSRAPGVAPAVQTASDQCLIS
ncbi:MULTISPECIES: NAD(P)/FAD-dependent oxidoreductase [Ralstonia]|nr:FAD-dependent oxidoreductase [Ralstonia pickettii]